MSDVTTILGSTFAFPEPCSCTDIPCVKTYRVFANFDGCIQIPASPFNPLCSDNITAVFAECASQWAADPDWDSIDCGKGWAVSVNCPHECMYGPAPPNCQAPTVSSGGSVSQHLQVSAASYNDACETNKDGFAGGSGTIALLWTAKRVRVYGPCDAFCLQVHSGGTSVTYGENVTSTGSSATFVQYGAIAAGAYLDIDSVGGNPSYTNADASDAICGACGGGGDNEDP